MLASNKSFNSFDGPQKSFGFIGVNCVLKILLMRYDFQVIQPIVGTVKVFVVYFQSTFNTPVKRFPYYAVHPFSCVYASTYKIHLQVMLCVFARLYKSVLRIARPSFALLDRMGCGYAGAQKFSDLFKGSAVLKHLLGLRNLGCINGFASSDPAHISQIAHLVQIFKIQNWFPRFHSLTPFNVNRSIA